MMQTDGQLSPAEIEGLIEESAEDLYENAPCGYISTLPSGTIVRVNATFLSWIGYERHEVLHKKRFQDLLTIGGKIYYETHFSPLLQMQGFVNEIYLDLQSKSKQQLPVLLNMVQLKSDEGKPLLNRTTLFNISDRKKYEAELLLARKKAEAAAKAKAEFLSTVSHEIRTPLNAIIGISNLLSDTEPTGKQRKLIDTLRFSADNLLRLINDILDFSKIESGVVALQETDFNLRDLIYSILYSLNVKAEEKHLHLDAHLPQNLPEYVLADQIKIAQVLTNLVSNALKFTEAGSVALAISVTGQTEEHANLHFAITDTGIGIAPDQLKNIFEEFNQGASDTNIRFGGTGLGLAISRKLLQLYNSDIQVESEPGKGSTFSFGLQLKLGKAPAAEAGKLTGPATQQPADERNSLAGAKLLLAEDNEINVFVVTQFLDKWGVQYHLAENGQQALDMVQKDHYHLVLMDLQMPVLDGYQASAAIRQLPDEQCRSLPIIALSASTKFDLQERLEASQITDFIGKPFQPAQLHALIGHYSGLFKHRLATPAASATAAPMPHAPVNLQQYLDLTEGDPKAKQELFQMTIRNLEDFRKELLQAVNQKNEEQFRFQAHKVRMILQMLEATQALEAIQDTRELLAQTNPNPALLATAREAINETLELVIQELQNHLPA